MVEKKGTSKMKSKQKAVTPRSNPVDKHVGNRIRLRRTILGLSQEKLAKMVGLSFQQVQKYEKGHNRVCASRLFDMGKVLGVPIQFFFEDIDEHDAEQSPRMLSLSRDPMVEACYACEEAPEIDRDPMKRQETLELVNAYYAISDRDVAKQMLDLLIRLAGGKKQ